MRIALLLAATGLAMLAGPALAQSIQLGPRPFHLVDDMDEGPLKRKLASCANGPFERTDFSIGHRGAALQFAEHTRESYVAAARMGAGLVECDVTFTADRQLVCRHSQCDLHTTTDILARPALAAKCSEPFTAANPARDTPASAQCCTSDITLAEFRTLCGKMDGANENATSVAGYLAGTANWRTDLYSSCATLLSHADSIALLRDLGVKFTPELKAPEVKMPFDGDYTPARYAQALIDEYVAAGIAPDNVWPQSFNLADIEYWLANAPAFARQAVYLDARPYKQRGFRASARDFAGLRAKGVNIVAPPIAALLTLDENGRIGASDYARLAREAGLDIITWTLERSGPLADLKQKNPNSFYYRSVSAQVDNDGDVYEVLDVLAREAQVLGVFSDWPATTTYYANCMQ